MSRVDPFMAALGVRPDAGPEAWLGLSPGFHTQEAVLAALQSRLAMVSARPGGDTAAADAAREALHAAAQRLLALSEVPSPPPPGSVAEPESDMAEVRAMLASPGGLDEMAFARLTAIANARGTTPQRLVAAATGQSAEPAAPAPVRPPAVVPRATSAYAGTPVSVPPAAIDNTRLEDEVDPTARLVKLGLLGAAITVAFLGIGAILLTMALRTGAAPAPNASERPAESGGTARGPVIDDGRADEKKPAPRRLATPGPKTDGQGVEDPVTEQNPNGRVREWADVVRTLDGAVANAKTDPEGATSAFERVVAEMSTRWVEATPDGVLAASSVVIDFLFAIERERPLLDRAAGAVVAGLERVRKGGYPDREAVLAFAWSGGMATRAATERELPGSVQRVFENAIGEALTGGMTPREPTFPEGLACSLNAIAIKLVPESTAAVGGPAVAASWESWLTAVEAAYGKGVPASERAVGLALELVLTRAAEPTQDRVVYDLVGKLVTAMSWRKDSPARPLLMRWFQAEGITSGDLQAVTSVLATRSGAEGVDPTMVLSATSGPSGRSELRDRYASAWELLQSGHGRYSELARWEDAARERLGHETPQTIPELMLQAVLDARLCRAAAELSSGAIGAMPADLHVIDADLASKIVQDSDPNAARLTVVDQTSGNPWAVQYLVAERSGSLPEKLKLLTEFSGNMDRLTAEVIAEAAFRGSPDDVRKAALGIVKTNSTSVAMVNAVLGVQPKIMPTVVNSQLIEQIVLQPLPSTRDPSWRVEARRALVGRLLQLMAGESSLSVVDALAKLIADAYSRAEDAAPAPAPDGPVGKAQVADAAPSRDPLVAARSLRLRYEREAERAVPTGREVLSLSQIVMARRQRETLAQGVVQRFNVEQLACVDLLGYLCVAEDPTRLRRVSEVLASLQEQRHKSATVIEQIAATERAALRLWVIRVGVAAQPEQGVEAPQ